MAVDGEERVIAVNEGRRHAARLNLSRRRRSGAPSKKVVRNPELQGFVAKAVTSA